MAKLWITVDVDDDIEPNLTDPHEIAELIVDVYGEWHEVNPSPSVLFVGAEWDGNERDL